eukprot:8977337-Alexandrium_andersonii.AAC.1
MCIRDRPPLWLPPPGAPSATRLPSALRPWSGHRRLPGCARHSGTLSSSHACPSRRSSACRQPTRSVPCRPRS